MGRIVSPVRFGAGLVLLEYDLVELSGIKKMIGEGEGRLLSVFCGDIEFSKRRTFGLGLIGMGIKWRFGGVAMGNDDCGCGLGVADCGQF